MYPMAEGEIWSGDAVYVEWCLLPGSVDPHSMDRRGGLTASGGTLTGRIPRDTSNDMVKGQRLLPQ